MAVGFRCDPGLQLSPDLTFAWALGIRRRWLTLQDTLLPLTTGSSQAIQFSSYGDLPAVIHIGRIVPITVTGETEDLPFAAKVLKTEAVAQIWVSTF